MITKKIILALAAACALVLASCGPAAGAGTTSNAAGTEGTGGAD